MFSSLRSINLIRSSISIHPLRSYASKSGLQLALQSELKYEKTENKIDTSFIDEFKAKGVWKLNDVPGKTNFELVRQFGNETITCKFDIDNFAPSAEYQGENGEEDFEQGFVNGTISIKKDGVKGEVEIQVGVSESIFIENVSFSPEEAAGNDYLGPDFQNLDENLIEQFNTFLEERGLNGDLIDFVNDYSIYKEQAEYVNWLQNLSDFVEK